ncbi:DNA-3-methyladenine glycosylase I [Undibacterium squillarum]|uniref:DNA-3-methyladenine glycosylase I n=1 Tax=Undibacterium squillarum TaxID=1131567 RepID=A0ABQ2XXI3_9BURK|nr:DNA-3-methyladenine glycosylase I [Undibacterium squillarum]GGX40607.1 DNA-3-methyladenine glycosylase I [Undibacterium squillarum]
MQKQRCRWANPANPLYLRYHDEEWGVPCHDELRLFEMLNLEGAQAGLSWETVLNKREAYRAAFDGWNAELIAAYDAAKVEALMQNAGIIRNRRKIEATISNARCYLQLKQETGGLDAYLWGWTDGKTVYTDGVHVATSPLSDQISKDLKKRGFKFVGSTIIYAYLQATGIISDHDAGCDWRHKA